MSLDLVLGEAAGDQNFINVNKTLAARGLPQD